MPKKYRLIDRKIIKKCAQFGTKRYTKYFVIKSLRSDSQKFTIVVSKKVDKRATIRNKLKRQLRFAINSNINIFPKDNVVIIVKTGASNISYSELSKDLLRAFDSKYYKN